MCTQCPKNVRIRGTMSFLCHVNQVLQQSYSSYLRNRIIPHNSAIFLVFLQFIAIVVIILKYCSPLSDFFSAHIDTFYQGYYLSLIFGPRRHFPRIAQKWTFGIANEYSSLESEVFWRFIAIMKNCSYLSNGRINVFMIILQLWELLYYSWNFCNQLKRLSHSVNSTLLSKL